MKKKLQTKFSTRQYMLLKDFEIYYYNDSHFSGVQSHIHNYFEFFLFLEGDVLAMLIDENSLSAENRGCPPDSPRRSCSSRRKPECERGL